MDPQLLNEFRSFNLAAEAILPILNNMYREVIDKMVTKCREGKTEFLGEVSRLEAVETLIEEIKRKSRIYTHQIEKLNKGE